MIDDNLEEVQRNIQDLISESHHPELKKHAKFLKKFARAMAYSLAKPKKIKKYIQEKPMQLQVTKQPIGYDVIPVPIPGEEAKEIHEFTAIPIYAEQFKKIPEKIEPLIIPLIIDKFTNKILVTAEVNETYKINEPNLDEADNKVLDKILRKKPRNPEKAWKLIEKYVNKYKANPEHKEAIKYYVINNLFALGKIEPLLIDKEISIITCDSPASYIKVKRNDKTLNTNIMFNTKQELDNFLMLISQRTNSKLDKNNPILDTMHREFRFHCVLGLDITASKFIITKT